MSNNNLINKQFDLSNMLIENINKDKTFKQLILNGANINISNELGWCVLFEVTIFYPSKLNDVLKLGANINHRDKKERNALFWSIHNDDLESSKTLISNNISLLVKKDINLSAIFYAIYKNNLELLKILFIKDSKNIFKDNYISKCLIFAVLHNKIELIDFLLEQGADINYVDSFSHSALSLAYDLKIRRMIEKLKDKKCLK